MSKVAHHVAENDLIHPELLGRVLQRIENNPSEWTDFKATPTTLLKYLWHVMIRFGTTHSY